VSAKKMRSPAVLASVLRFYDLRLHRISMNKLRFLLLLGLEVKVGKESKEPDPMSDFNGRSIVLHQTMSSPSDSEFRLLLNGRKTDSHH
jgi:hypothetical protein